MNDYPSPIPSARKIRAAIDFIKIEAPERAAEAKRLYRTAIYTVDPVERAALYREAWMVLG